MKNEKPKVPAPVVIMVTGGKEYLVSFFVGESDSSEVNGNEYDQEVFEFLQANTARIPEALANFGWIFFFPPKNSLLFVNGICRDFENWGFQSFNRQGKLPEHIRASAWPKNNEVGA